MLSDMWELWSQLAPGKPQLGPGLNAGGELFRRPEGSRRAGCDR